jgi:hypothetical protein
MTDAICKLAAAALPAVLAWGALGWYAWRVETRRINRLGAVLEAGRKPRLSETPYMVHVATWDGC